MELVDGEPLSVRLADGPALDVSSAALICSEIAEALAAAHARGFVHRDIKPENVIITETGVKLVDFGISAPIGAQDSDDEGQLLGTPTYLAPERIIDTPVGPAADVYSLGVLLYRMLSGTLPWSVDTKTRLLEAHMFVEPAPLPPITGLRDDVAALVDACLSKDPRDRPSSAEAARILADAAGAAALGADLPRTAAMGALGFDEPATVESMPIVQHQRSRTGGRAGSCWRWPRCSSRWPHRHGRSRTGLRTSRLRAPARRRVPRCSPSCATRPLGSLPRSPSPTRNSAICARWRAGFVFPGDQAIRPGTTAAAQVGSGHGGTTSYPVAAAQAGRTVTVVAGPNTALANGATGRDDVVGVAYHGANLLPTMFTLDGQRCETQLADRSRRGSRERRPDHQPRPRCWRLFELPGAGGASGSAAPSAGSTSKTAPGAARRRRQRRPVRPPRLIRRQRPRRPRPRNHRHRPPSRNPRPSRRRPRRLKPQKTKP